VREGIILRLIDEAGNVGWGEIAPLPWFGSETLQEALAFCQQLGDEVRADAIAAIPCHLPACQFGFESALSQVLAVNNRSSLPRRGLIQNLKYSCLLPAGETALQTWQPAWQQGGRTFKWKIGVNSIEEELKIFFKLVQSLPAGAQLRLDANGGLTVEAARRWLEAADLVPRALRDRAGVVEFLEQPLPPSEFDALLELGDRVATPLALDESVATVQQLEDCYARGWRGIFVIKAAIAGSTQRLRQFCQKHCIDAVFSSVFETQIGRQAVLQLAAELSNPNRAIGFGVEDWFASPKLMMDCF
jgi:o-succinylbenzoate synthase